MTWGTFTPVHFATLALAALGLWGLYALLRHWGEKNRIALLGVLSFSGIGAIIFNLLAWNAPMDYLPLHLCSVNAVLLPFAVLRRNKTVCNLLLLWSLGAVAALVANWGVQDAKIPSWTFFFYYVPHTLEFGIPILLFKLGLAEKDPRCIGSTLGITMLVYTGVHFINVAINRFTVYSANYMYSVRPENPLLALFYKVIPHPYWYMYMITPILAVYLLAAYAPQIKNHRRARPSALQ